jgi:hypothetical protein
VSTSPHPRDATLNKVERQHASRRRALAGTRTPYEDITKLFLAYGGRDGMYRQELGELIGPAFSKSTVDRWARVQIDAGRLTRRMHGRQAYLVWLGDKS